MVIFLLIISAYWADRADSDDTKVKARKNGPLPSFLPFYFRVRAFRFLNSPVSNWKLPLNININDTFIQG